VTKEAVVRQFFIDFIENLGESLDDDYCQGEITLIPAELFFSGSLEIKWDPEKQKNSTPIQSCAGEAI